MKKIQTIFLVAFLALAFAMGSCKKDEPAITNEPVVTPPVTTPVTPPANAARKALLTKKWRYVSFSQRGPSGTVDTKTTNWGTNFVEFKGDNSFEDTYHFKAKGTYSLSADGNSFTIATPQSNTISISSVTETTLVFSYSTNGVTYTFSLAYSA